jgi:hypothetical protein
VAGLHASHLAEATKKPEGRRCHLCAGMAANNFLAKSEAS